MKHTQLASITQLTAAIALAMTMFGCGGSGAGVSGSADSRAASVPSPAVAMMEPPVATPSEEATPNGAVRNDATTVDGATITTDGTTRGARTFRLLSMQPTPAWGRTVEYVAQVTLNGSPAPKGTMIHIRFFTNKGQYWARSGKKTDASGRIYWKNPVPTNPNKVFLSWDLRLTVAETGHTETFRIL